ncbi:MAG: hypothetical protein ACHQO8_08615, partial [Vicinamibacterales bacterium]
MSYPRSSRQRYRRFREDYRLRRLDDAADGAEATPKEAAGTSAEPAPESPGKRQTRRAYLREYGRWLWPHRYAVGVMFVLALVAAGLQMVEPLFLRFIVDSV